MYATLQAELYGWKLGYQSRAHALEKANPHGLGSKLESFAGLDFHSTLKRLCLQCYGKVTSLTFTEQMSEYTRESQHVALRLIQTWVQAWAFKRRAQYKGDDHARKIHRMWLRQLPNGEVHAPSFVLFLISVGKPRPNGLPSMMPSMMTIHDAHP